MAKLQQDQNDPNRYNFVFNKPRFFTEETERNKITGICEFKDGKVTLNFDPQWKKFAQLVSGDPNKTSFTFDDLDHFDDFLRKINTWRSCYNEDLKPFRREEIKSFTVHEIDTSVFIPHSAYTTFHGEYVVEQDGKEIKLPFRFDCETDFKGFPKPQDPNRYKGEQAPEFKEFYRRLLTDVSDQEKIRFDPVQFKFKELTKDNLRDVSVSAFFQRNREYQNEEYLGDLLKHIKSISISENGCSVEPHPNASLKNIFVAHHEGEVKLEHEGRIYTIPFDLENWLKKNEAGDLERIGRSDLRVTERIPKKITDSFSITVAVDFALNPRNTLFWAEDAKYASIRPVYIKKDGSQKYITYGPNRSPLTTKINFLKAEPELAPQPAQVEHAATEQNINTDPATDESQNLSSKNSQTEDIASSDVNNVDLSNAEVNDDHNEELQNNGEDIDQADITKEKGDAFSEGATDVEGLEDRGLDQEYIYSLYNIDSKNFRNIIKKQFDEIKASREEFKKFLKCWANNPTVDPENALLLFSQDPKAVDVMSSFELMSNYSVYPKDDTKNFIRICVGTCKTENLYRISDCVDFNTKIDLPKKIITNRILYENRHLNAETLSILKMPLSRGASFEEAQKNTVFNFVNEVLHNAEIDDSFKNNGALDSKNIKDTGELLINLLHENLFGKSAETEISDQFLKNISLKTLKELHPLL